ncbi:hypothetical protein B0H67DRAFT_358116 [Lasiosphaeris hirsuta]|uniref:Uncharacterized protein n=1 Tax=Lasiosphaeris hirsuta TaxID=260670 RepID=A0AA39ZW24_9PEZI|nr:hypothetical protein B0H67DRAFT_358116 [Lasiosphaeris hirsuta]
MVILFPLGGGSGWELCGRSTGRWFGGLQAWHGAATIHIYPGAMKVVRFVNPPCGLLFGSISVLAETHRVSNPENKPNDARLTP